MANLTETLSILLDFKGEKAIGEMKKAGATAERELGKASDSSKRLGNTMMATGATMVASGLLITKALGNLGDDFVNAGKDVLRLQRMTGETAEKMSGMRYAAQMSGVSVDALAKGYQFLAKNMQAGNPMFERLGIAVRDANGHLRGTNDVMLDVSNKFKTMTNVSERNAAAQQLFGRSYQELLPLLNKGGDEIARLAGEAEKYGLVLNDQNLGSVKEYIKNQREMEATMQGLKIQIGSGVVGALNSMAGPLKAVVGGFQSLPGPARNAIGTIGMFAGTGLVVAGAASTVIGAIVRMKDNFGTAKEGAVNFISSLRSMDGAMRAVRFAAITGGLIALGTIMQKRADDAKKMVDAFDLSGTIPEQLDKARAELNKYAKELEGHKYNEMFGITLWDTNDAADAAQKYEEWASKIRELEGAQKDAANATDLENRGVDELGNTMDETTKKTDEARRAQDELWSTLMGSVDSQAAVTDAWARVNDAIGTLTQLQRDGKAGTADYANGVRDLTGAVEGYARKTAENYAAQITANGGTVTAWQQTAVYRDTLQQLADKYPAVRAQLQPTIDMANRTIVTQFLINAGFTGDSIAVKVLQQMMAGTLTPDQMVKMAMDSVGVPTQFRPPQYRARGGSVMGGHPYVVGERGPETFVPGGSGTIVPADAQVVRSEDGSYLVLRPNGRGGRYNDVAAARQYNASIAAQRQGASGTFDAGPAQGFQLGRRSVTSGGPQGGMTVNVTINGWVGADQDIAHRIMETMRREAYASVG